MTECIICGVSNVSKIIRNELPMFECQTCALVWRQEFDVSALDYTESEISLGASNIGRRISNVKGRISCIEGYVQLNNLCDVGAGEGMFLSELKKRGNTNVIGIEPNKEAISYGLSQGVTIFSGTLTDASRIIREHKIRTVTLFHVIEHLDNPRESLESIFSSLDVGDHIVVETPNADAYSMLRAQYRHPLVYKDHLFYFNTKNLPMLLECIGFKVIAKGKRGFDEYNMSIKQALFYLGFGKFPFQTTQKVGDTKKNSLESASSSSVFRTIARKLLSILVVLFGRVDYQWVIAER